MKQKTIQSEDSIFDESLIDELNLVRREEKNTLSNRISEEIRIVKAKFEKLKENYSNEINCKIWEKKYGSEYIKANSYQLQCLSNYIQALELRLRRIKNYENNIKNNPTK